MRAGNSSDRRPAIGPITRNIRTLICLIRKCKSFFAVHFTGVMNHIERAGGRTTTSLCPPANDQFEDNQYGSSLRRASRKQSVNAIPVSTPNAFGGDGCNAASIVVVCMWDGAGSVIGDQ